MVVVHSYYYINHLLLTAHSSAASCDGLVSCCCWSHACERLAEAFHVARTIQHAQVTLVNSTQFDAATAAELARIQAENAKLKEVSRPEADVLDQHMCDNHHMGSVICQAQLVPSPSSSFVTPPPLPIHLWR